MQVFVALLRGINVGGNNILPMQDLRELLSGLGCVDVATYIQSGNAVFRHSGSAAQLSASIADGIESGFGFRPAVEAGGCSREMSWRRDHVSQCSNG